MKINQVAVEQFWQTYLATLSVGEREEAVARGYEADAWGDSPEMADKLGALIAAGTKTATCGSLWDSEAEGEPIPKVGQRTIVVDGHGEPLCMIEITEITLRPYNEVDAQFAYEEGENDRTLASWREGHRRFFTRILEPLGLEFSETMPLICERFRLLYPHQ